MRKVGPMLDKIDRHKHSLDSIIFLAIVIRFDQLLGNEGKYKYRMEYTWDRIKHSRDLNDIFRFSEPCFARWCNLKPIFSSLAKGKCI